jgi:aryl-alcohol dehydrogenase-like predicted oxidoreductase
MGMSGMYGPADELESMATIHAAIDSGVTLLDTGDFYGMGHNEILIGRALKGRRDRVQLSVKFGAQRGPDGAWLGFDGRPAAVKSSLAYSLVRLGVDYIDVYRPARLDPGVPIEETVGAITDLVGAGYVRAIGLSEVGVDTLRRAHAVHPIVDVQLEYSLISRKPEQKILPALAVLGVGMTAYGVLSRGLLSGAKPVGKGDFRAWLPRFSGNNLETNQKFIDALQTFADARGISVPQVCIAWVLAKSKSIVPLIGSRTRAQLADSLRAIDVHLSPQDMAELEQALPESAVAGTRYDEHQMKMLDSER